MDRTCGQAAFDEAFLFLKKKKKNGETRFFVNTDTRGTSVLTMNRKTHRESARFIIERQTQ